MSNLEIYMIRHGRTSYNEEHLYLGYSDIDISENGRKELEEIKEVYKDIKVDKYFTSGAIRAISTLQIFFPKVSEIEEDKKFLEYNFGDFEGKSYEELKLKEEYIAWITDEVGEFKAPGGESKKEYKKRVVSGFKNWIRQLFKENIKSALMVSHGGTIGTILSELYDNSKSFYDWQPKCGRGYKLVIEGNKEEFKIIKVEEI